MFVFFRVKGDVHLQVKYFPWIEEIFKDFPFVYDDGQNQLLVDDRKPNFETKILNRFMDFCWLTVNLVT